MPQKNKKKFTTNTVFTLFKVFTFIYMIIYIILLLLEIYYIYLIWSSYKNSDEKFNNLYCIIKNNIIVYIVISFILLTISSFVFPVIGWFAFIMTLFIVFKIHCDKNENFSNMLNYKSRLYCPDSITYFNEAEIERNLDGTRSAYSSAVGDIEDIYWLPKLLKYQNKNIINYDNIKEYGNIFEMINTPRPLYTTSLLSKEIGSC